MNNIASICLAIGIALAGYFISNTLYKSSVGVNTADVKGLAERQVKANRVNWNIGFSLARKGNADIDGLYKRAELDQNKIVNLLKSNGINADDISLDTIDYSFNEYRNDDNQVTDVKHTLRGQVVVQTDDVQLIKKVRNKVNSLIAKGVYVNNYKPTYLYTKLNDIKPEMVKEATANARIAANEFAANAGAKVGSIKSARQGGFIIRDVGESYGDTAKIDKTVRVVTTISFYLED